MIYSGEKKSHITSSWNSNKVKTAHLSWTPSATWHLSRALRIFAVPLVLIANLHPLLKASDLAASHYLPANNFTWCLIKTHCQDRDFLSPCIFFLTFIPILFPLLLVSAQNVSPVLPAWSQPLHPCTWSSLFSAHRVLGPSISLSFSHIFNLFFSSGSFPSQDSLNLKSHTKQKTNAKSRSRPFIDPLASFFYQPSFSTSSSPHSPLPIIVGFSQTHLCSNCPHCGSQWAPISLLRPYLRDLLKLSSFLYSTHFYWELFCQVILLPSCCS